jgi:LuxR family transcriptional regulator of csgAB operon
MVKKKGAIVLVTEITPQSQLFLDYLQQELGIPVNMAAPDNDWTAPDNERVLVLIDVDHANESSIQEWQSRITDASQTSLAAFNLDDENQAADMLSTIQLQGVFYRNDALPLICKGLLTLLDGHLWMSRSLMGRMLELFRLQQQNAYRPAAGLTQRELEIIGLLGSGASNVEIAERLAVSENTVKSHLYNIFKKIDVHNRVQAVNWARQNLGAPPQRQH